MHNPDILSERLEALALTITLILWGVVGLLWIIHREFYQFVVKIRGVLAIFWGTVVLILCWGGASYLIIKYFLR
jgi:hypothetical protein